MMKVHCCGSKDIISNLPQGIIENILTCMPIRDAVRTSILSRKWMFCWTSMPKLKFNDKLFRSPSSNRYKFASAILHVLLLHTGSILMFSLDVGEYEMVSQVDQIIRSLSRNKNLQKFSFEGKLKYRYKLPSSFFSLHGLEVLELTNCEFKPPLKFNGYTKLKSLKLSNVTIASNLLQTLLSSCPLLMDLYLHEHGHQDDIKGGNKFTFVEFFQCVPLIRILNISSFYMKYLGAGGMPEKLLTSLVHLKYLYLDVCLTEQDSISSVFGLLRSSPNLEKISLRILNNRPKAKLPDSDSDSDYGFDPDMDLDSNSDSDIDSVGKLSDSDVHSMTFTDFQDYSGFNLDYLKEFTVENFTNKDLECEFMKLIMAKSPMLKTTRIKLSKNITPKEESKILRDMIRLPFSCASPAAVTIVEEIKR